MAQQHILEGTVRELAPYFAQHPDQRIRVIELAEEKASEATAPVLNEKAKAAIAFFETRIAKGLAADEATKRQAEEELAEFKRNMNANREATGERLVYP